MSRTFTGALVVAAAFAAAACGESTGPGNFSSVNTAFSSLLAGYGNTQSSFDASADSMAPWRPGDHDGDGGRGGFGGHHGGPGFGGPGFGFDGGMMGGGLGDLFRGAGFGPGFGHGPHGDNDSAFSNCTFNSGTGRLDCATDTHNGLTITRSIALTDKNGATQQAFDSINTNTINERVTVSGTVTRRDGATSTVSENSDRTVSGLAQGSTQRTVNGTSAGTENTTGSDSTGAFTVARTAGDTTKNVVIPLPTSTSTTPPFPTAGTVVRNMKVVVTRAGSTTTSTRREVVTYDGSTTAKVAITQDGTTKQCTVALPHGRLTCS